MNFVKSCFALKGDLLNCKYIEEARMLLKQREQSSIEINSGW